jgi:hypothetical protein
VHARPWRGFDTIRKKSIARACLWRGCKKCVGLSPGSRRSDCVGVAEARCSQHPAENKDRKSQPRLLNLHECNGATGPGEEIHTVLPTGPCNARSKIHARTRTGSAHLPPNFVCATVLRSRMSEINGLMRQRLSSDALYILKFGCHFGQIHQDVESDVGNTT